MTFLLWIEKGSLRQLIVDMRLPVSVLRRLTSYARAQLRQSDIQIYLLVSDKTPL